MQAARAKLLSLRESLSFATLARLRRTKVDWVIRNLRPALIPSPNNLQTTNNP